MKSTNEMQTSNAEMVTISRAEYEKLLGQGQQLLTQNERISHLENQVELLMEALRLAQHKRFGASSEKSEDTLMEQLSFLFNEAEVFSAADKEEAENVTVVAAHKRHKKHEYTLDSIPEGIETRQVEHRLEGEDLVCSQCGDGNKIRHGYREKQKEGLVVKPPFGYWKDRNTGRIRLHPEASATVQIIYGLYCEGLGQKEITRRLNAMARRTPQQLHDERCGKANGKVYRWTYQSVKNILAEESYTGLLVNHRTKPMGELSLRCRRTSSTAMSISSQ